jgi:hypothetical protein
MNVVESRQHRMGALRNDAIANYSQSMAVCPGGIPIIHSEKAGVIFTPKFRAKDSPKLLKVFPPPVRENDNFLNCSSEYLYRLLSDAVGVESGDK